MLRLLLEAGATVVAEAAFQDNVWTPNLVPLTDIAHLRIVQCHTDPETARQRMRVRSPSRQAHADAEIITSPRYFDDFVRVRLSVPSIAVDTVFEDNGVPTSVDDELIDLIGLGLEKFGQD